MVDPQDISEQLDYAAWNSIRASIGQFDNLVMTLLTQATALVFGAFALVLANANDLGPFNTALISVGLTFGMLMLQLGVWRYTYSLTTAVESAQAIENKLFGTETTDPRRITHRLARHPLAIWRKTGRLYYNFWAAALTICALAISAWRGFLWLA